VIKNVQGVLVQGEEALQVWKESFENLLGDKNFEDPCDHKLLVRNEVENLSLIIEEDDSKSKQRMNRPIEMEEVSAAIRSLKGGKAAGLDGISIEMLKAGGEIGTKTLLKLFQVIWNLEYVPGEWGKGIIVPILKRGHPAEEGLDTGNYRGITLINIVPKVFTKIIYERLSEFCECEQVLAEEQAGFRKARAPIDQVYILHEMTKGRFPKKTYCCFLDIQKAYDRVWREGLWYKLFMKG
jgi:hypothetical protein